MARNAHTPQISILKENKYAVKFGPFFFKCNTRFVPFASNFDIETWVKSVLDCFIGCLLKDSKWQEKELKKCYAGEKVSAVCLMC